MNSAFSFPEYRKVVYLLNAETGKYEKQPERIPFNKLPNDLKVETTWEERIRNNGASQVITGRINKGKRLFFTGIIPVIENRWYMGNDYKFSNGVKSNSLVVFRFSDGDKQLSAYYFSNYYKFNREERITFVLQFIQHLNE
jgi:hypothetical protein